MSAEVEPRCKPDPEPCPCGCGAVGRPKRNGHVLGCDRVRCPKCRGKNNKRSGAKKQRMGISVVEKLTGTSARFRSNLTHEETHDHLPIRVEVKSGLQVGPADTALRNAHKQLDQNYRVGNNKPPAVILMPTGQSDGWFACRLSVLAAVVDALSGSGEVA